MTVPTFSVTAHMVSVNGSTPTSSYTYFIDGSGTQIPSVPNSGMPAAQTVSGTTPVTIHMGSVNLERGQTPPGLRDLFPNITGPVIGGVYSNTTTNDSSFAAGSLYVLGTVPDPSVISITFHVDDATSPDLTVTEEIFGHSIQFVVYRLAGVSHVVLAADYNKQYFDVITSLTQPVSFNPPTKFRVFCGLNVYDQVNKNHQRQVSAMKYLGVTNISYKPDLLTSSLRSRWTRDGIPNLTIGVYTAPGGYSDWDTAAPGDSYETPDSTGQAAWALRLANYVTGAGYSLLNVDDVTFADEPFMPNPAQLGKTQGSGDGTNPSVPNAVLARTEFTNYLIAQGVPASDLGLSNYSTPVMPLGRRAQSSGTTTQRALFYWSMRWLSQNASSHYANCVLALEAAFNAASPSRLSPFGCRQNFNNSSARFFEPNNASDDSSLDRSASAFEWLNHGRLRGATRLWTEDWFFDNQSPTWSPVAAKLRCAAKKSNVSFGGYTVAADAGGRSDGILKKSMTLIGHGAKAIFPYTLMSPEYNMTSEGALQNTLTTPSVFANILEVSDTLSKCEDLLYPGVMAQSQVAILMPQSAQPWDVDPNRYIIDVTNGSPHGRTVDYMGDAHGIYTALQHANYQVDWIDEDDLNATNLAPYLVVYVTTPNLSSTHQNALNTWMNAGGTLVLSYGSGTSDRYNSSLTTLNALVGTQNYSGRFYYISGLGNAGAGGLPAYEAITYSGAPAGDHYVRGPVGTLTPATGSTTVATFASAPFATNPHPGTPAITYKTYGSGRLHYFSFFPGVAYTCSQNPFDANPPPAATPLPTGFDLALRQLILDPVINAGVVNPISHDGSLIETPVLQSSLGWAITFLNWTDNSVGNLNCTIRPSFVPTRITSYHYGDLTFSPVSGGYSFSVPLASTDVIRVYAPTSSPSNPKEVWGMVPV